MRDENKHRRWMLLDYVFNTEKYQERNHRQYEKHKEKILKFSLEYIKEHGLEDFKRKLEKVRSYQKYYNLPLPKSRTENWKGKKVKVARLLGKFVSWKVI
jgi:hypothetical protein